MKKIINSALACAAIIIVCMSCNKCSSGSNSTTASLSGKWKLDSVISTKIDSTNDITPLVNVLLHKDSTDVTIEFGKDSIANYNDGDTAKQIKYYLSGNARAIFIKEDTAYIKYDIITQTATALHLQGTGKDSSATYFTKK